MYPFGKPLLDLTFSDLEKLCADGVAENEILEFKEDLAFGEGGGEWQDRLPKDRHAKIKLAKELVAFANANGGTLLLGVSESKDNRASALKPLCDAEDLKERLVQIVGEIVEPPIRSLKVTALLDSGGNKGVLVFNVDKSLDRPHRVNMKQSQNSRHTEAYTRRGTNSEPMTMLEIQQLSVLRNREIDLVISRFDKMLEEMKEASIKYSLEYTQYRYSFLAFPLFPMSVKLPEMSCYTQGKVKLVSEQGTEVGNLIDYNANFFRASKVLGGRYHQFSMNATGGYIRFWWMKDGSFKYFCDSGKRYEQQPTVNPFILFAPLCYLAHWIKELERLETSANVNRMACGFVLDNSNNMPLSTFQNDWDAVFSIPDYSPVAMSEIYEFIGIEELEKISIALAQDLFDAFNAEFPYKKLHFEKL